MNRLALLAIILGCLLETGVASYSASPGSQYHIQTDEGPERYFRYQTYNGQYRKEKRLQDGTVIGSDGWIDANGYLRLRDYIADNEGYRVLKSKTVFVGQNRPIEEAIKMSKSAPAQSGILVKAGIGATATSTISPYLPPVEKQQPQVYISHNSIDSSTERPKFDLRPTVAPIAATSISSHPTTFAPSTSTVYISSTPTPDDVVAITQDTLSDYRKKYYSSTFDPSTNALNLDPFSPESAPIDRTDQRPPKVRYSSARIPARYQNISPSIYNQIGNGYDPQYSQYNGISVTDNGFRYYLPKQYHEEENSGGTTRAGSFGYVDPFGIRRVIYYNTSPNSGFVHRKNNRYVGHNGTPYDPRPL